MIKIKDNQTGKERIIPAKYYFESEIRLEEYQIIEWKDVVHVYTDRKNPTSLGVMSRLEAQKYIDSGTNYYFENVPRPDLKIEPVITPERADIAAIQTDIPAIRTNIPTIQKDIAATQTDIPAIQSDIPATQTDIPAIQKSDKLSFIKNITLFEWAAIGGLLALIVALWTIFFN